MVYVLVVGVAVVVGLVLGGRLSALMEFRMRSFWLVYIALGLQVVAFPSGVLPWSVEDMHARVLWVGSYGFLIAWVLLNERVRGAQLAAAGIVCNLSAVIANGGVMPTLPEAATAAGFPAAHNNSVTDASPHFSSLVDRWAAPDWLPLANVYSVGDLVLALGAFAIVMYAMRVPLLGSHAPAAISRAG